jgi:hypothetical protein
LNPPEVYAINDIDIKIIGDMTNYVVFLRAVDGKIAFLREYFDPVRAAKAMDAPILGLES